MRATAWPQRVKPLPWEVGDGRPTVLWLLEWALADQRVDGNPASGLSEIEARAAGLPWRAISTDGVARIEQIAAVGRKIDISGPQRPICHPVADLVVHVLDTLTAEAEAGGDAERVKAFQAVRFHARRGTVPGGWSVPARWYQPADWVGDVPRTVRQSVVTRCPATGRQRRHVVEWTPIVPVRSWEGIKAARHQWSMWRSAVRQVWLFLSMSSLPFSLSFELPPERPWEIDGPGLASRSG